MSRDKSAIPASEVRTAEASAFDIRALHPFRTHLTGSIRVTGADPETVAALRETALSVATGDASSSETGFDAVVLIDPSDEAFGMASAALKPGGHLIVVVENGLNLSRAVHGTGGPLGLFAERDGRAGVGHQPPTHPGLRDRLAELGLTRQDWWFPFPSHRLALSLVSARGLAAGEGEFDPGLLAADAAAFAPSVPEAERPALRRAWAGAARAGLLSAFAPAFVVVASSAPLPPDDRLALHFGHRRRAAFDKVVSFAPCGDGIRVSRTPLHPGLPRTVEGVTNRFPDETYIPGVPWQAALRTRMAGDGWTLADLIAWASIWWEAVRTLHAGGAELTLATLLPGGAVDAIPRNLLYRDGAAVFIDAEWEIECLTAGHLLVRGLVNALTDVEVCGVPASGLDLSLLPLVRATAQGLGLPLDGETLDAILAREARFQTLVSGRPTRRDRAWLAATRLPVRTALSAPFAERDRIIARLEGEVAALRAEAERRVAAVTEELDEARRRTDRVIRYAAELDRERGRLTAALDGARARVDALEADLHRPPARRRYRMLSDMVGTVLPTGLRRTPKPDSGA